MTDQPHPKASKPPMPAARVFVSCGQRGTEEPAIAAAIEKGLRELGFEPYVAINVQSLRALRENLFPMLKDTEYFIFVDFRREEVESPKGAFFRGSLFSHQELAIASFLEKEPIVFQEKGVRREGLLDYLHGNPLRFSNRAALPKRVLAEVKRRVKRREWSPTWRHELALTVNAPPFSDALSLKTKQWGRYFHIRVTNHHRSRLATDCTGFLYAARRLDKKESYKFGTVEFKWAGSTLPFVSIVPGSYRQLDALLVQHIAPRQPYFNTFADSNMFFPSLTGPGDWELTYGIVSGSMPPVTASFRLHIGLDLESVTLTLA